MGRGQAEGSHSPPASTLNEIEKLPAMSETETWPPTPGPQNGTHKEMTLEVATCPSCQRRLLTQTSALCNWCGAKIDNPEYQERAARNRHERDAQERAELESMIQEEAEHGILGRLRRLGKQNKKADRPNLLK